MILMKYHIMSVCTIIDIFNLITAQPITDNSTQRLNELRDDFLQSFFPISNSTKKTFTSASFDSPKIPMHYYNDFLYDISGDRNIIHRFQLYKGFAISSIPLIARGLSKRKHSHILQTIRLLSETH